MSADLPIKRATIEEIVQHRDKAVSLYEEAWELIEMADARIKRARAEAMNAHPGINGYNAGTAPEVQAFLDAVNLPDRAQYSRTARRLIDINVWAYVIERTDLEHLMDREAKDDLRKQMEFVPERVDPDSGQVINEEEIMKGLPPVTVDTVEATLMGMAADAGTIFQRGIANAFSKLDRRFKSHDGFKIGARIILSGALDDFGWWNHYRNQRDDLIDIERVFLVLDGKDARATYAGIVGAIDDIRKNREGKAQDLIHGDYFRARIFKNGNIHLWFERDDLVEKVNKLLADYYGEVLSEGQGGPDQEDPFADPTLVPAKFYGFYPTPTETVQRLIEELPLYIEEGAKPLRILEPSAGTGNFAQALARSGCEDRSGPDGEWRWREYGHKVDCVEIQPHLAKDLESTGLYRRVRCGDFLKISPDEYYDIVCMNPPFDRERDIDHVMHAWKFLKTGGTMIAIMSAGTEWRETKKAKAFRKLMKEQKARWTDLPPGTFSSVGTNVNTLYVKVTKS